MQSVGLPSPSRWLAAKLKNVCASDVPQFRSKCHQKRLRRKREHREMLELSSIAPRSHLVLERAAKLSKFQFPVLGIVVAYGTIMQTQLNRRPIGRIAVGKQRSARLLERDSDRVRTDVGAIQE